MTNLGKRVDRLEQVANEIKLRGYLVELAEERGLNIDRLMVIWQEVRARTAAMRARGMTVDEIVAATAAEIGITATELRAHCEELAERYGLA